MNLIDLYTKIRSLFKKDVFGTVFEKTVAADNIQWSFNSPLRIIAIGDLHGDISGLACLLYKMNVIDKKGNWIAQNTHIVLNGDIVGGEDDRILLNFIMRLQREALKKKSRVHALLGNHDILIVYDKTYKTSGERLFHKFPYKNSIPNPASAHDYFLGNTALAKWTRSRNAIVKIGTTIFAHAGLNDWALTHKIPAINTTIRAWIKYWQGTSKKPDDATEWVVKGPMSEMDFESSGPMWTRSFKLKNISDNNSLQFKKKGTPPDLDTLNDIFYKYKAKRLVVGHAPVPGNKILLDHPYYGDKLIMIDTKISSRKGNLSCLIVENDSKVYTYYTQRKKSGIKIRNKELKRIES